MRADPRQFLFSYEAKDGRLIAVVPLLFGEASITIGPGGDNYDGGYSDCWWYPSVLWALVAVAFWNPATEPEPPGWTYHPFSRRRRPGGDPAAEYVDED